MKFSDFKVGTRLSIGFAVLLVISLAVGGISWLRMHQIDSATDQIVTVEWEKARLSMEMQIRSRDNLAKAGRMLMATDEPTVEAIRAEMSANSKLNEAALAELDQLVTDPEDRKLLEAAA